MAFFRRRLNRMVRILSLIPCFLGAALLVGDTGARAAVTTVPFDISLENWPAPLFSYVQIQLLFLPTDILPGDTVELHVHFSNAFRLVLADAALPDASLPGATFQFYSLPGSGGNASGELEFIGVNGSLIVNPIVQNLTCSPTVCETTTPDLTNTSFDFTGFILRMTPQFGTQVHSAVIELAVPEGVVVTSMGPGLVDPPQAIPDEGLAVEYSNDPDEAVAEIGGTSQEIHGAPDPGQTLYAEPLDVAGNLLPDNGLDFFPADETGTEPTRQVDALAYGSDAYLSDLFSGKADLLFSVVGDGAAREWALLREETDGVVSVEYFHQDLVSQDGPGGLDDLDAAELWGDLGVHEARYYSLRADAVSGTSVFVDVGGASVPFVTHAEIVAAVESLGYAGEPDQVDVDGMMVRNAGGEARFEEGDVLLFSIRATPDGNFDGGELIELRPGQPAKFLQHGGHVWDTGFDLLALLNPLNGGVDPDEGEDVDALEATLASWAVGLATGRVPDGGGPEPPLTVVREPNGDLTLSWGVSCTADDTDYEIYTGAIGSYYSHYSVACSTAGQTSVTMPPPLGSQYYLVVPTNTVAEGSYGLDSSGAERPQGSGFCRPPAPAQCGP